MIEIHSNDRIFCCGRTRSGKSVLIKSLLLFLPRVIFHDRKHEHGDLMTTHHFSRAVTPEQVRERLRKGGKRILYQPLDPSKDDMNEISKTVFDVGNITLIVDEASALFETNTMPYWSQELYRLGAQRGIGVWALSQRPRAVNNVCISEANHVISFRMNLKTDRIKIVEICGDVVDAPLRTLPAWHFMLYDGNSDELHWCGPIRAK